MRLILSFMVIVGHAVTLNGPSDFWVDPIGFFVKFTYSASLAVKIFFFLSGLLLANSLIIKRNPIQFVVNRVFRIMPALLFLLLITVFVIGPLTTRLSVSEYIYNLDYLKYIVNNLMFRTEYFLPGVFDGNLYRGVVNGSLWSLRYEVGCYLALLSLFLVFPDQLMAYWKYLFILILAATLIPSGGIINWLGSNPEIYLLPVVFSFGVLYGVYASTIEISLKISIGLALLFFLFKGTAFEELIFVFAACNLVIYLAGNSCLLKFRLKYDLSYGVYLWGFLVQQLLYLVFGHLHVALHCVLSILISLALAFVTHIWIEKPFMELGKNIYGVLLGKIKGTA